MNRADIIRDELARIGSESGGPVVLANQLIRDKIVDRIERRLGAEITVHVRTADALEAIAIRLDVIAKHMLRVEGIDATQAAGAYSELRRMQEEERRR